MTLLLLALLAFNANAAKPADLETADTVVLAQGEALPPTKAPLRGGGTVRLSGKGMIVMPCVQHPYAIASVMRSKDETVRAIGFVVRLAGGGNVTVLDSNFDGIIDDQLSSDGAPNTVNYQQIFDDGVTCTAAKK